MIVLFFVGRSSNPTSEDNFYEIYFYIFFFFPFFFWIQFNVPFKITSLIETSQSIGGAKRVYPGKTTWHISFSYQLFQCIGMNDTFTSAVRNVKKILWPWIKPMIRVTDCTSTALLYRSSSNNDLVCLL